MTRVAIIGNSHVGAYVEARERIEAAFPGVKLGFFAFPRHQLSSATYGQDGVLRIPDDDRATGPGGLPRAIDLAAQDHILLVGQQFGAIRLKWFLDLFDVLGFPAAGAPRLASPAVLTAFLQNAAQSGVKRLSRYFRGDARVTYAPLPLTTDGARPDTSSLCRTAFHPAAAQIMPLWHDAIERSGPQTGLSVLPQPAHLRETAVFTPRRFARATALPDPARADHFDYNHMNTDYALEHFRAYAKTWPQDQATTPPDKES